MRKKFVCFCSFFAQPQDLFLFRTFCTFFLPLNLLSFFSLALSPLCGYLCVYVCRYEHAVLTFFFPGWQISADTFFWLLRKNVIISFLKNSLKNIQFYCDGLFYRCFCSCKEESMEIGIMRLEWKESGKHKKGFMGWMKGFYIEEVDFVED